MTLDNLLNLVRRKRSMLCVGLDTDAGKLPHPLRGTPDGVFLFNKAIIEATADLAVAYKINTAFYEAAGPEGWEDLRRTLALLPEDALLIADAKRGDIGNTAEQYAKTFFETYPFDAVTVAPYMGRDSVKPFLNCAGKWTILLGLTSNPGSADFQQLIVDGEPLWRRVIRTAAGWGGPDRLMFVAGATHGSALADVRAAAPEHFLLVPGVGAQGGSVEEVCRAAAVGNGGRLLINVSRGVLYAADSDDFADAARRAAQGYQQAMQAFL